MENCEIMNAQIVYMSKNMMVIQICDTSERIELFIEMLQTIYHTDDVKGYEDGYLDQFFSGGDNYILIAEDVIHLLFQRLCHHDSSKSNIWILRHLKTQKKLDLYQKVFQIGLWID